MTNKIVAAPLGVARRTCPVILAALASFAVAYGFEVHPMLQIGTSLPLSDIAPGLAQAFAQLGNLPLPALTRQQPSAHALI